MRCMNQPKKESLMERLRLERDGSILRLTLNRPDSGNAIDLAMAHALLKAAIDCDEDPTIRCVIITGAGKHFCLGGDITEATRAGAGFRWPDLSSGRR